MAIGFQNVGVNTSHNSFTAKRTCEWKQKQEITIYSLFLKRRGNQVTFHVENLRAFGINTRNMSAT